jgi:pyridoxal phosphate enzyme (YggS family)
LGVAANLAAVRARIAAACERAGRDPGSVRLVAVSKTQPVEAVLEAFVAGQRDFGENYAQELRDKAEALPEADWHFIGALQSNKAKIVVGRAALVHTCDRASLAEELHKRAFAKSLIQPVLVEVNLGREPQKGGALPEDVEPLLRRIRELPSLLCQGLMCIPPASDDSRRYFRDLRALRDRLGDSGLGPLTDLSMGMSADYEAAIEEGATIVRVGTAIFGERPRSAN